LIFIISLTGPLCPLNVLPSVTSNSSSNFGNINYVSSSNDYSGIAYSSIGNILLFLGFPSVFGNGAFLSIAYYGESDLRGLSVVANALAGLNISVN
jgi:hypothetical protein